MTPESPAGIHPAPQTHGAIVEYVAPDASPNNGNSRRMALEVERKYGNLKASLLPFQPVMDWLQTWGLLIIHLVFTVLLAYYILAWIKGLRVGSEGIRASTSRRMYVLGSATNPREQVFFTSRDWLLPGGITTLVAIGTVIIKPVTGSWTGLTAWSCARIILEKEYLTFREIRFMVSNRVVIWPRGRYSWATFAVLLLLIPAQVLAPLVSGSISWIRDMAYVRSDMEVEAFPSSGGDLSMWNDYINLIETRNQILTEALSYSWSLYRNTVSNDDNCRRRMANMRVRDNSLVTSMTIPYLRFDSITWEKELPPADILGNMTKNYLENSVHDVVRGRVSILDMKGWNGVAMYGGLPRLPQFFGGHT